MKIKRIMIVTESKQSTIKMHSIFLILHILDLRENLIVQTLYPNKVTTRLLLLSV